ncbi:hypothetical protein OCU04_003861 [Sclerotinia nivalis]|uniref:Uncharacterized protein n=1 Tax=Sclerotinia nivalis TaxID=352851 RepID=A0A9X0DPQ8_9HELO|nr:hypothetical protein OCU04_003861 [Sclerotinia nivalis]
MRLSSRDPETPTRASRESKPEPGTGNDTGADTISQRQSLSQSLTSRAPKLPSRSSAISLYKRLSMPIVTTRELGTKRW